MHYTINLCYSRQKDSVRAIMSNKQTNEQSPHRKPGDNGRSIPELVPEPVVLLAASGDIDLLVPPAPALPFTA